MRIASYTIVHYGSDYLPYALRSIYHDVDIPNVLYTAKPSHGHSTTLTPPEGESRQDLLEAAFMYNPDKKIKWWDYQGQLDEGPQRDTAVNICRDQGADIILVVDCDEIWRPFTLREAINYAWQANSARNWLINFTHLWRSFGWCCRDDGWPVRLIDLRHSDGTGYIPRELGEIYHFGYAVRDKIMRYKWSIHGHKAELRAGWLDNQWSAWPPQPDCHPTNEEGFWTPESFDRNELPGLMKRHPFYNLERID